MRGLISTTILLVAFATTAAAQECLTGEATLSDQRALAALRAATETACPCDSFAGAQGRRLYARCVRGEIKSAREAEALRSECVRAARGLYRRASCGTDRVPCGRAAGPDAAASCRLASPAGNACGGDGAESACGAQTHCAEVVQATAGTCIDPNQPGPFGVGVRTVQMTKDSVATPGTPRVLDTVVWYPAAPGAAPINTRLGGVVDAPLDNSGGPYPLLMFSHGSCGYAFQSTFLTMSLASHGIIVAAPPHPGNTIFEIQTCGTGAALVASLQERPNDIIFATDQLAAAAADSTSPFFGAIDPARVGMSGHSFGGLTTYLVVDRDPRYRIAVPMAGAAPAQTTMMTIPSLSILSELDSYVNNARIRAEYAAASAPKIQVEILNAGHFAFSDGCFPSPDCTPPVTLTQDEAHAVVQRWVLPFVRVYLAGDERYAPLLEPVPPGVLVEREGIGG